MKTEPTEACKMIEESWYAIPYMGVDYEQNPDIVIDKEDVYEIVEKAFQEGQSSPKIKQLEWEESDGEYLEAITPIGTYSITFDFGVYVALYDMDNAVDGEWRSLAKAKIACNNDFEKRVMECLDINRN